MFGNPRRKMAIDGSFSWVKMKNCGCKPPKLAEVRFSETIRNPRKPYYKCRNGGCGFFDWVYEEDVCVFQSTASEEIGALKQEVQDLSKFVKKLVNLFMAVIVVLVIVLVK